MSSFLDDFAACKDKIVGIMMLFSRRDEENHSPWLRDWLDQMCQSFKARTGNCPLQSLHLRTAFIIF